MAARMRSLDSERNPTKRVMLLDRRTLPVTRHLLSRNFHASCAPVWRVGHTRPFAATVPLHEMADAIRTLLLSGGLHTLFQPILDGATREAIGYEALSRGPQGHELNSPLAMIAAAARCGMSVELERACINSALGSFRQLRLQGRLCVEVAPKQ